MSLAVDDHIGTRTGVVPVGDTAVDLIFVCGDTGTDSGIDTGRKTSGFLKISGEGAALIVTVNIFS